MVGDTVSGMARCPYDPKHANVALFAGMAHLLFGSSLSRPHVDHTAGCDTMCYHTFPFVILVIAVVNIIEE